MQHDPLTGEDHAGSASGRPCTGAHLPGAGSRTPALATEFGGGAYHNGAEDFLSGAAPPPGNYFINYFEYYSADKFKNGPPDFKANVAADVLRFIHISDKKFLGGLWVLMYPALSLFGRNCRRHVGPESQHRRHHHRPLHSHVARQELARPYRSRHLYAHRQLRQVPSGESRQKTTGPSSRSLPVPISVPAAMSFPLSSCTISTPRTPTPIISPARSSTLTMPSAKRSAISTSAPPATSISRFTDDKQAGMKSGWRRLQGPGLPPVGPALNYDYKNMSFSAKYHSKPPSKTAPSATTSGSNSFTLSSLLHTRLHKAPLPTAGGLCIV